jgi:hypothetical protein
MAKKKSILSLISQASGRAGSGATEYVTEKIKHQIQSRLDPRNFARMLGGPGLLGDAAVALTSGVMNLGSKKGSVFGRKRNKNPQYSSISGGPIRPLRMGDASADILGKMYNFMRKTDELAIKNREIENAFRQEQLDEDERRHQELVKAIKAFTKKPGKTEEELSGKAGVGAMGGETGGGSGHGLLEVVEDVLAFQGGKRLLGTLGARFIKSKLGKFLLPKSLTKVFGPKTTPTTTPTISEPTITTPSENAPKGKIGGKGTRAPAPRGSAEAKGTYKDRLARNRSAYDPSKIGANKTYEPANKSLTRTEKSVKYVKDTASKLKGSGAAKTAVKISSKALKAGAGVFKFIASIPGLSTVINLALLKKDIDEAEEAYKSGEIDEKEYHKRIVHAVGGALGAIGGGIIGAEALGFLGTWIGGPIGAILGGIGGGVIGSLAGSFGGEMAADALFKYFQEHDEKEINALLEKMQKIPVDWSDKLKNNNSSTAIKNVSSVTTAQSTAKALNIPQIQTSGGASSTPVVSVNNTMNNVGGKPPKVLSTNTARQRNSDLDKYLRTTVVPV